MPASVVCVQPRFPGYSPPPHQCQPAAGGGDGGGGTEGGQPPSAVSGPSTSTRADSAAFGGLARPMVRFSQPLSTINETCSQVASACNYSHHQQPAAVVVPQLTTTITGAKSRRQLRARGNTAADISLHFGPPSSPEKPPQLSPREAVTPGRRRVTVVGAPRPVAKQRPTRSSLVDERYPATTTMTTAAVVKPTSSRGVMTPVG